MGQINYFIMNRMHRKYKKYKAFTMIEILVVISVMTILALILIVYHRDYNKLNQLREATQQVRSAMVEAQNLALAPKDSTSTGEWRYGFQNYPDSNFPSIDSKTYIVYKYRSDNIADTKKILRSYRLPNVIDWGSTSFRSYIYFTPPNAKPSCTNNILTGRLDPPIKIMLDANNFYTINLNCTTGQISMSSIVLPPVCFAADSKINVLNKNGTIISKQITEISTGDLVESSDSRGQVTFSEVWAIMHTNETETSDVLVFEMKTKDGNSTHLALTSEHFLYVLPDSNSRGNYKKYILKKAKDLRIGDKLFVHNSQNSVSSRDSFTETTVTSINLHRARVVNILTMNDRIVVNGVLASTYGENQQFYTVAALGPKFLYKITGPAIPNQMVNLGNKYIQEPVMELIR